MKTDSALDKEEMEGRGTVKFFNVAKGFGFISPDNGDKEIFFPAASFASAGVSSVKAGQRVSFETQPEKRGPKAVNLTLLADPQPPPVVKQDRPQPSAAEQRATLTIYHDPASEKSCEALEVLCAAGYEPRVIEYLSTPLTRDELKALSMLLRDSDQSLVRRYDPLFLELRLDDRFIGENEFWDAIAENPSLINGPVIASATKASVCRSQQAVRTFLAAIAPGGTPIAPKPKKLSPRVLQLVRGETAIRPIAEEKADDKIEKKPGAKAEPKAEATTVEKPKAKTAAKTNAKTKPKAKTAPKAKTKVVANKIKPAKKITKKTTTKVRRTAK